MSPRQVKKLGRLFRCLAWMHVGTTNGDSPVDRYKVIVESPDGECFWTHIDGSNPDFYVRSFVGWELLWFEQFDPALVATRQALGLEYWRPIRRNPHSSTTGSEVAK